MASRNKEPRGSWWCTGKGSCGKWNYAGNRRCFSCARVPGHVPVGEAEAPEPQGAWSWANRRRTRLHRERLSDGSQQQPGPQAPPSQDVAPSSIQVIQDTIKGLKSSGMDDPDLLKQLEDKLEHLKQQKKESKSTWQQARDSDSMLIKKKKALAKAEQEMATMQLEIEGIQAKVQLVESKVVDLKTDIKRLEAEADLVPKPTAIAEALGIPSIPKEVLGMERGKILMDEINSAISSLLELAKDIDTKKRGMEVEVVDLAGAAAEEAAAEASRLGSAAPAATKTILMNSAMIGCSAGNNI